jgi:hypothetical protein
VTFFFVLFLSTRHETHDRYATLFLQNLSPHLVLLLFLPALIFESAFTTNFHIIKREFGQVGSITCHVASVNHVSCRFCQSLLTLPLLPITHFLFLPTVLSFYPARRSFSQARASFYQPFLRPASHVICSIIIGLGSRRSCSGPSSLPPST